MRVLRQTLSVPMGYAVHFTRGVFAPANPVLRTIIAEGDMSPARVLVVLDSGACARRRDLPRQVERYCTVHADALRLVCAPMVVPGGERAKDGFTYVQRVHEAVDRHGLCRHSYVIGVGGGAVLDMVGFAAATAHRGIRLVRVPTTVLAQNDSGVGVKNGINAFGKKNFIGTFAPPHSVVNDALFLRTLSDRDWRSGTAEAVKVALLRDPAFFTLLERRARDIAARDLSAMESLIHRCAELHVDHIANGADPFENGTSRPLDFGHWSAHKLEQLTRFRLRHGEAVAIGLALDSTYSHLSGRLPYADWQRILRTLSNLGFRLEVPPRHARLRGGADAASLEHGLVEFREHLGGELTIMLLAGIGSGVEVHEIDHQLLARSIRLLRDASRQIAAGDAAARRAS